MKKPCNNYNSIPQLNFYNQNKRLSLEQKAQSLNLPTFIVQDAGRTQVTSGSRTVLGIFGEKTLVDQVTGQLKLL